MDVHRIVLSSYDGFLRDHTVFIRWMFIVSYAVHTVDVHRIVLCSYSGCSWDHTLFIRWMFVRSYFIRWMFIVSYGVHTVNVHRIILWMFMGSYCIHTADVHKETVTLQQLYTAHILRLHTWSFSRISGKKQPQFWSPYYHNYWSSIPHSANFHNFIKTL